MRFEEIEFESGREANFYRIGFQDNRVKKILKRYGMEKWYNPRTRHDYDIISDILKDNKDALAEAMIEDSERKEEALKVISEEIRTLETSGRKAENRYRKLLMAKNSSNKYDSRDEGKRDYIEAQEEQLSEWERNVEKQAKKFFQLLGFMKKRSISADEVDEGTLGMTVGESQEEV